MSAQSIRNTMGLSAARLETLRERFSALGDGVAQRALAYVVDDADDEVLTELAGDPGAADALQLTCRDKGDHAPSTWDTFFRTIEPVGPAFYLRLAKVFEAAGRLLPRERIRYQHRLNNVLWVEVLLRECWRPYQAVQSEIGLTADMLVEMLAADGQSPDAFISGPFVLDAEDWKDKYLRETMRHIPGLGHLFAAHRDLVGPLLLNGSAESRRLGVELLALTNTPIAPFSSEIVQCATDPSKRLREFAQPLLRTDLDAMRPHLERLAREGKKAQRENANQILSRLDGGAARPTSEPPSEAETAAVFREAAAEQAPRMNPSTAPNAVAPLTAPPYEPLPLTVPVTESLRGVLATMFEEYNARAAQHNRALSDPALQSRVQLKVMMPEVPPDQLATLCRILERDSFFNRPRKDSFQVSLLLWTRPAGAHRAFLEHPDCHLLHVLRFFALVGLLTSPKEGREGLNWVNVQQLEMFRRSHLTADVTLRHVAEGLKSLGLPDSMLLDCILTSHGTNFDWGSEAVWPFFLEHVDALQAAFEPASPTDYMARYRREAAKGAAFRILADFPQVPPKLAPQIWDLAIGGVRDDRRRAQPIAAKIPDIQGRIAKALASGSYQTRAVAAEWLGRLGDRRAVPILDAAARNEKQDAALDEILAALERLGEPIEPYLDRDRLQREAVKGLKKGIPDALAWFTWSSLPAVHWRDTGELAPVEVIMWLLVQNFRLKSAEAGPLLRRYCAMLVASEREQLGEFVLQSWLSQDLKCDHTDAEARRIAQQRAPALYQQYQNGVRWHQQRGEPVPVYLNASQSQVEDAIFQQLLRECGSAVKEKGILAVAGACCGPSAVAPVQKYLKEWYGYRAAQCKALIAMLSTIEHPSAIQYLLSISNRFRTKGIREEAEKYVQILAERKGWTLDELGDRTLPTAGLDDDGTLPLDFGPRQFIVRVNADLEPILADGEGKVLKALPAPRKGDDPELAKAAKKAFSTARSELKRFADLQRTRLYEAMCTQRVWPVADWRTYLLGHPLMRFLCQRIVWSSWRDDTLQQTFRPLDDGTFTDSADEQMVLADDVSIRIAHECEVSPATAAAWIGHLADYDVETLFMQFGRGAWRLPDDRRRDTSLDDFLGHLVEAFKLRGLATKLGYTRGRTEDGGWFYEYAKSFPGLGLQVHLGFSGNALPEENLIVALTHLVCRRRVGEGTSHWHTESGLPLGDVPAILLSECYHDLRAIAATGSGYEPEWEKKVRM